MIPPRVRLFLCVLAAWASLSGCAPKHAVDAEALSGPLNAVSDRHDAYVRADESLSEVERNTALRSSELLRGVVSEALSAE
jgi:hypothetical protein